MHGTSFPKFDLSFNAFVFLVPLLYALHGKQQETTGAFRLFYWFSFFSYLIMLYWIPNVMMHYGGMGPEISYLGIVLMAAFFSLFTGAAGWLIKKTLKSGPFVLFMIPFIWVAKDLLVEHIITGFPWCFAGYSQYENLYFIQMAEIGGVHLVTFFVIFFNVLLYLIFRDRMVLGRGGWNKNVLAILVVCTIGVYSTGYFLYQTHLEEIANLPEHTAGILQPNTSNDQRLGYEEKKQKLEEFFSDSKKLMEKGAEFVVWPEFTISIYPLQSHMYYERFMDFTKSNGPILGGFTDFRGRDKIYNSLILFEEGKHQKYDKVHLTPYGEYILYRELLFFVNRITDEIGDFTPGDQVRNLTLDRHLVSTPICYELIFPGLVRDFIDTGGELIIITSNDSWYGDTSAPYQLLCMSVFRSVENRRYILRSTTSGISAAISPVGEITSQSPFNTKDTFNAPFKYIKKKTIFTRFGYLFPYFCVLIVLAYFIWFIINGYRDRKKHQGDTLTTKGKKKK